MVVYREGKPQMVRATKQRTKALDSRAGAKKRSTTGTAVVPTGGKWVYFFGAGKAEGRGDQKELLGGKGAGLMEMTRLGLPVPAGFTITTEACAAYYALGRKFPRGLKEEVGKNLAKLERVTGKKLGDPEDPLLVSVRSGAAVSMPGMMETILNLGLNDVSVEGLARRTQNPRFAYDAYRRFIQMYSSVVVGLPKDELEEMLAGLKRRLGVSSDVEVPAEGWKELCQALKAFFKERTGRDFPQDPRQQLWGAIAAVFDSWMAEKAVKYREVEKITGLAGTAVNVVQMVFGNKGENSGTGVCFTRDPNTGEKHLYGDFLFNAQGEDVVAGIRTPLKLDELRKRMPKVYRELEVCARKLEQHYRDMQDVEFTIEEGKLYILQTRSGKRSPQAAFRIAADMVKERLIGREEAVLRIKPADIERLFYPVIDPKVPAEEKARRRLAQGINAVPGAAVGAAVFTAETAEHWAKEGRKVILVRKETSPEDVGGMHAAQGILTATGGKTSHAAVVARAWGKCCIVGCGELDIDYEHRLFRVNGRVIREGDFITLDGTDGSVYEGALPLVFPELPEAYYTIMKLADQLRTIQVRTNADTPYDAENARRHGAEGIGLTRTEHMFFDTEERRLAMQEMILAETSEQRTRALEKLRHFQREDFEGIFRAMQGLPVTIRLLDPPLHEFVPHDEERQRQLAERLGVPFETVKHRVEQLREANPMLGHRGCRLCITYPEILEMQVRAIMEAAVNVTREGKRVFPEIMHPLVMDRGELEILATRTREVADEVLRSAKVKVPYLVGTMIEVPRAALLAGEIAEVAEFFSFGTNDLTQMTMGLSRDDAGRFLPDYVDPERTGIFPADPFQTLDQKGVGRLIRMAIEEGRRTRPDLKVGICGEHGGDPASVRFCVEVGMDYVSCSPLRVPIARLAAAQAAIQWKRAKGANRRKGGHQLLD
jgi:pyruvate,orthophosphate dikinase